MRTRLVIAVVAVAAVAGAGAALLRDGDRRRALPPCAAAAQTIPRPRDLPRTFPFPSGTVFTDRYRNRLTHGVPQVDGRMPLALDEATRFVDRELPGAGFRLLYRQGGSRAFSVMYETKGYGGLVRLRGISGCNGATAFSVSARPTLLGRGNGA
jgi:hypothetical protein